MQTIQSRVTITHHPNIVELAAIWEAQRPQSTERRSLERELRDTLTMHREPKRVPPVSFGQDSIAGEGF